MAVRRKACRSRDTRTLARIARIARLAPPAAVHAAPTVLAARAVLAVHVQDLEPRHVVVPDDGVHLLVPRGALPAVVADQAAGALGLVVREARVAGAGGGGEEEEGRREQAQPEEAGRGGCRRHGDAVVLWRSLFCCLLRSQTKVRGARAHLPKLYWSRSWVSVNFSLFTSSLFRL